MAVSRTASPDAERVASDVMRALEEFRKVAPKAEVQTILVFLIIARTPGIRMKEIEKVVGLSSSAVSRNVLFLSDRSYTKSADGGWDDGLDLVATATDSLDVRAKVVSLSSRGQRLYDDIVAAFTNQKNRA